MIRSTSYFSKLFILCALLAGSNAVLGASIGLGGFSGSETVVDLGGLPGPDEPVVTVDILTFTSSADFLKQSGLTDTSQDGMFTLDLASDQQRVGLELNAFSNNDTGLVTWSIEVFDAGLTSLETLQFSQVASGTPIFAGIERLEGIGRLMVTELTACAPSCNYFTFINEARYENAGVVPLPAAAWLFGSALLGLGLVTRRHA